MAWSVSCFFFFNDTATTEIYTLSLHDALPICSAVPRCSTWQEAQLGVKVWLLWWAGASWQLRQAASVALRSEEHTSELQSQSNLVCRLLLEKKKNTQTILHNYDVRAMTSLLIL